jgi:hypothetical protein
VTPNGDNVIPLRPRYRRGEANLPISVETLAAAVDAIGHCLSPTTVETESGRRSASSTDTSILLAIGVVERRLEELSGINVATWPDVLWAIRFANARMRALDAIRDWAARLRAVRGGAVQRSSLAESSSLGHALRDVHDLIVERYPQTLRVCG